MGKKGDIWVTSKETKDDPSSNLIIFRLSIFVLVLKHCHFIIFPLPQTIDFEKIDEEFSEFMQHDSKVSLLQAVTDPDTFLTPDSSIKRLLNSHLYDVSRLLSRRYYLPRKDPLTKKWFSDVFEKWWSSFPNLDKFESEGLKLPDRNRTPSIKSYSRSRVHSWFGACLDRRWMQCAKEKKYRQEKPLRLTSSRWPLCPCTYRYDSDGFFEKAPFFCSGKKCTVPFSKKKGRTTSVFLCTEFRVLTFLTSYRGNCDLFNLHEFSLSGRVAFILFFIVVIFCKVIFVE